MLRALCIKFTLLVTCQCLSASPAHLLPRLYHPVFFVLSCSCLAQRPSYLLVSEPGQAHDTAQIPARIFLSALASACLIHIFFFYLSLSILSLSLSYTLFRSCCMKKLLDFLRYAASDGSVCVAVIVTLCVFVCVGVCFFQYALYSKTLANCCWLLPSYVCVCVLSGSQAGNVICLTF